MSPDTFIESKEVTIDGYSYVQSGSLDITPALDSNFWNPMTTSKSNFHGYSQHQDHGLILPDLASAGHQFIPKEIRQISIDLKNMKKKFDQARKSGNNSQLGQKYYQHKASQSNPRSYVKYKKNQSISELCNDFSLLNSGMQQDHKTMKSIININDYIGCQEQEAGRRFSNAILIMNQTTKAKRHFSKQVKGSRRSEEGMVIVGSQVNQQHEHPPVTEIPGVKYKMEVG